jgi:hypothetical protein
MLGHIDDAPEKFGSAMPGMASRNWWVKTEALTTDMEGGACDRG